MGPGTMTPTRKPSTPSRPSTSSTARPVTPGKTPNAKNDPKKKKPESPVSSKKVNDGRIVLNGKKLTEFSNLGPYQPTCQYLYARDNLLHNFYGLAHLPNIRVLDCSHNDIENLAYLEQLPGLKQLYLNSNSLQSVEDLPTMPQLEVLSLSANKIATLEGMKSQPNLRVLYLADNALTSYRGMPALPRLEVLRINGNPMATSCPRIRLASMLATAPSLSKLDGEDIDEDERSQASHYQIKCGVAIRSGWELCPGDRHQTSGEAHAFLTSLQKFVTSDAPCKLVEGKVSGNPSEWNVLTATFAFQCEGHTHASSSSATATQSTLPEHLVGSFNFQWIRIDKCGTETFIDGATSPKYTVTANDVYSAIKVVCTPVLPSGEAGVGCFAISDDVLPGSPLCRQLTVTGFPVEGSILQASASYVGGVEGDSTYRWMRCVRRDAPVLVGEGKTYTLAKDDVDAFIRLEYTPVRADGASGPTVFTNSSVIKPADPSVVDVALKSAKDDLVEGVTVTGSGTYIGGQEGESKFMWVRVYVPQGISSTSVTPYAHVIPNATGKTYVPTAADVGHYLKFVYTPVRADGRAGYPVNTTSTTLVKACKPTVSKAKIVGSVASGSTVSVSYEYTGGQEGATKIDWFVTPMTVGARSLSAPNKKEWRKIGEGKQLLVEAGDETRGLYCQISPTRNDGFKGTPIIVFGGVVGSSNPVVERIDVKGELVENGEVTATGYLSGGVVAESLYAWQRSKSDGAVDEYEEEVDDERWETVANTNVYKISSDDVGKCLRVVYTPLKADGTQGDAAWYLCDGKVTSRPPCVSDVSIEFGGLTMIPGMVLTGVGKWNGPGQEAESKFLWKRISGETVEVGHDRSYTVTTEDLNCRLSFTYIPVRDGDIEGKPVTFETLETVVPEGEDGDLDLLEDLEADKEEKPSEPQPTEAQQAQQPTEAQQAQQPTEPQPESSPEPEA